VTALVDGLQAAGLVQRDPHPGDRRAVLVRLTEAGAAVTRQLAADYEVGSARVFAGIPTEQVPRFLTTLDTLTARIDHLIGVPERVLPPSQPLTASGSATRTLPEVSPTR
jgi:DNA-binding MarR family transcriptional regulator